MRPSLYRSLLFGILLSVASGAFCQEKRNISGNFEGYTFARLAARLEETTGYIFYYDPAEVDSLLINIRVTNVSLRQLLNQVFRDTRLHYAIDTRGRVFVTSRPAIRTSLPSGLFRHNQGADTSFQAIAEEEEDAGAKPKFTVSEDNHLIEVGDKNK